MLGVFSHNSISKVNWGLKKFDTAWECKNLKRLLVVANILIIICLVMVLILKTKLTYSLYWSLIPFLIVLIVAFIREVDKGRIDTNIDKSKLIKIS